MLYSSLGLSFVISYTSIMAYSLLKTILIAVKCINILEIIWKVQSLHSSCFHKCNSQNGAYLHWCWPTQNSEKYEPWHRPWLLVCYKDRNTVHAGKHKSMHAISFCWTFLPLWTNCAITYYCACFFFYQVSAHCYMKYFKKNYPLYSDYMKYFMIFLEILHVIGI